MGISDIMPWRRKREGEGIVDTTSPLLSLRREMDRIFEDFLGDTGSGLGWANGRGQFAPQINVKENERAIEVTAELPGMTEKDINLSLEDGLLTIRGEKRDEREEKEGERIVHFERRYGFFERNIRLSAEVNEDEIQATCKNGVLTIVLPKTPEAQRKAKKISVRAA